MAQVRADHDERASSEVEDWPELPVDSWGETIATLHLWTQVVGKIRLVQSAWLNHSWGAALYVTARGLTTSLVPYGNEGFELEFDFLGDRLQVSTTTGRRQELLLRDRSVADIYKSVMRMMGDVGMPVTIFPVPSEIPDAIPFPDDDIHAVYDPGQARALWRVFVQSRRVFTEFRAGFVGKASPVYFFWGSFDLAVTRFSGRVAPPHPGGIPNFPDDVAREAYAHEVTSVGFWPGNTQAPQPIFYAMPTRALRASRAHRSGLMPRSGSTPWGSSPCRTTSCGRQPTPMPP